VLLEAPLSADCVGKVSDSCLHHRSDRWRWRLRHRYAQGWRRHIGFARHDQQPGFGLRYLYHDEQYRVPQILIQMESHALPYASDRERTERITQKKQVRLGTPPIAESENGIQGSTTCPAKVTYRAMWQVFG